jgi:hypothetical protein
METEFIKSLHSNYERVLLDSRPDEQKYQYCIISKGGIKGLLPCSLRYINGDSYLYYDITSKQNLSQLFRKRLIDRQWVLDFVDGIRRIRQELDRFLLNDSNILWFPEHVFQDLEDNILSYIYIPYLKEDNGFSALLDFIIDKMDYEDDALVDFVYKMYEQYDENGDVYLQGKIYDDVKIFAETNVSVETSYIEETELQQETNVDNPVNTEYQETIQNTERKKLFSIFENKRSRDRDKRNKYRRELQLEMDSRVVAETPTYETDYGRTVYIPETVDESNSIKRLYTPEGKMLIQLEDQSITIGKISGDADLVLDDFSVSRIHARISKEENDYFLEDLNSTNGTFKNGLRLNPYEKRKLQEEDEITLGKITIVFR